MAVGGGGRSFPIFVDYISRNANKVIGELNAVSAAAVKVQSASTGAARGANTVAAASQNMGAASAGAAQNVGKMATATQAVSGALPRTTSSMLGVSRATEQTGSAMATAAQATGRMTQQMGRGRTMFTAFRNAGRGAQFAIIGLIGSINEAVFMIERTIAANQKVAVAQAEVNRLTAEGKQGTSDYTRAVQDLEEAQRGAQFTSRIMAQSVLDNVTFMGMLGSQLPKVINEYRRLRAGTAAAGAEMAAQTGILTRLRGMFTGLAPTLTTTSTNLANTGAAATTASTGITTLATRTQPLAGALSTASVSANAFRTSVANTASAVTPMTAALGNVGSQLSTLGPGFGRVAASSTVMTGALRGVAPTAAAATAATLPLAAGMRLVDTTSKSIIPTLGATNAGIGSLAPTSFASAGALGVLTGALRTVGHAMTAFIMHPVGMVIVAIGLLIAGIVALRENWFGVTDSVRGYLDASNEVATSIRETSDATDEHSAASKALSIHIEQQNAAIEGFLNLIGAQTEEQKQAAEAAKRMSDELQQLVLSITDATNAAFGFAKPWQDSAESAIEALESVAMSNNQTTNTIVSNARMVQQMVASTTGDQKMMWAQLGMSFEAVRSAFHRGGNEIRGVLSQMAIDGGSKIQQLVQATSDLPNAFAAIPKQLQPHMEAVVEAFDLAAEGISDFPLTFTEMGQIIEGVINGQMVPAMDKLDPAVKAQIQGMIDWALASEDPAHNLELLAVALTQGLGNALIFSSGKIKESETQLSAYAQRIAEYADEAGIATEVTEGNAVAIADQATATKHAAAEQAFAAAQAKLYADAVTGLNEESQTNIQTNQRIINSLSQLGQGYDDVAVGIAGHSAGIQTWRNELAQAHFNIAETAAALGYMGDTSRASIAVMLEHIAVQERQNEVNQTAVEGYFSLSESQQTLIDSSGEMAQRLGEVAIGAQDVTAADAALIAEQVKLNEANQAAAETYLNLDATQRQYLESLGITPALIDAVIRGDEQLDQVMIDLINTQGDLTEAVDEHAQALSELNPAIQELARSWGLATVSAEQMNEVYFAQMDVLSGMQGELQNTTNEAVAFVAEQGRMADITGMTVTELAMFIQTMELTGETAEQAAERQAQAAKEMAEAWERELDRVIEAWNQTSEELATAAENIGDDIGDAGAEGAIAFTEGFMSEFVPQQLVEEAFDKNIDMEDVIDDIKDEAEDALEDGLISELTMREAIEPMIDALEEIPGENERAMGEAIAVWRHYKTRMMPIVVGGIHEVGQAAQQALHSGVIDPFRTALEGGAGTGAWQPLIDNFRNVVNALPPEYDRMKGDWLKTLELLNGDTRGQVNHILAILSEISPEFAEQVMNIDRDADGIKDIFDTDVKEPAEAMRDALVDAFIMIFDALALVNPEFAKVAEHLRNTRSEMEMFERGANAAGISTAQFESEVRELAGALGMTVPEAANLRENFDGYNKATGEGIRLMPEQTAKINELTGAAKANYINFLEAALKADLFADGIETAGGNADTAAGQVRNAAAAAREAKSAFEGLAKTVSTPWGTVTGQAGGGAGVGAGATGGTEVSPGTGGGGGGVGAGATAGVDLAKQFDTKPIIEFTAKIKEMETAWTNQLANNGAQITAFITGPLTQLAGAYTLYQANVIPILAGMELAWTMHLANNTAQITAFITGPLTLLAQAYMLYQTNVIPILQGMELAWTMHLANNGAQISAFITGPLTLLAQAYTLFQTNVVPILQQMELAWTLHLANNGQQIANFIAGPIINYMGAMNNLAIAVHGHLETSNQNWGAHVGHVSSQVSSLISGPISGYINAMPILSRSVHGNLESANQNWAAHADHVGSMATASANHVNRLANAVRAAMSRIISSMNQAANAARQLQAAINALKSKTITVTTNYKTTGAKPAAAGFSGIVRGPQLFLAGEAGPEHVRITPLQGAATSHGGIHAMAGQAAAIAAKKGADVIVSDKMDAKAISNFVGERGMRLDEFKESEEGKQIDVEVRRVYKNAWIDKGEWKDFAKDYGYKVSDFDKKKKGKLADIMFKRMKNVRFQERDTDWDEDSGEPSRKTVDWGQTRGGGRGDEDATATGGGGGGTGGGPATAPVIPHGRGGRAGGGGGGTVEYNSRTGGKITVYTDLNVNLIIDKRNMGKIVQQVITDGSMTTK